MLDKNYTVLTKSYFEAFNERDTDTLKSLYSDSVVLTDWYGSFVGNDAILAENSKLFQKEFSLTVTETVQCGNKTFSFITLTLDEDTLHIMDVLEWDEEFKIKTIEAYWR